MGRGTAVAVGERRWSWRDTRRVLGAGGALVAGGLVARTGVPEAEQAVFEAVNGLPGALYPAVWLPMQLGSLPGGLVLAGALGVDARRRTVLAVAAGAVVTTWVVAKEVKEVVQRSRPLEAGMDVVVHDGSTGLGYASGHAAVAFAIYTVAAPHLGPRWRPVALGLAGFVALARVYSGAHLPLDVVGGAGLGVLVGEGFRSIESLIARRRWGQRLWGARRS